MIYPTGVGFPQATYSYQGYGHLLQVPKAEPFRSATYATRVTKLLFLFGSQWIFRMLTLASMMRFEVLMFDDFEIFQSFHKRIRHFCIFPSIISVRAT